MDPAVIAALITTPTTVIAATAAYAAGRAQARGAHQGPVDAVRRQHQRDAYSAFLVAANSYADGTNWSLRCAEARHELEADGHRPFREQAELRALELVRATHIAQLRSPAAVVDLEGPVHIARAAGEVSRAASVVRSAANAAFTRSSGLEDETGAQLHAAHQHLTEEIEAFTLAARAQLNNSGTHDTDPRRR